LAGAVAAFWGTMERGWPSVLGAHESIARRSAGQSLFDGCGRSPEQSSEGALDGGF